jgi:beta-alanine degradation protein BauB
VSWGPAVDLDPVETNPDHYRVILENERVRVLEYRDEPGERTTLHGHPDSVMYTLSSFRRRLSTAGGEERDVELTADTVAWVPAQHHAGHNIGDTPTRVIFVELKEAAAEPRSDAVVGPGEVRRGS